MATPVDPLPWAIAYFAALGQDAYLVGGRVRDRLSGRRAPGERATDTDIVVGSGALDHARHLAAAHGGAFVPLDPERGIARVVWAHAVPRQVLDITDAVAGDLSADLAARDFTINAMAVPLAALSGEPPRGAEPSARRRGGEGGTNGHASYGALANPPWRDAVVDPHGGMEDLVRGRLRALSPAAFEADPLRLLRGVRLAAELGFEVERNTRGWIRERASLLQLPAPERQREELLRLLAQDPPADHLDRLEELGLREVLLPELGGAAGPDVQRAMESADAVARLGAMVDGADVPSPNAAAAMVCGRHRRRLRRELTRAGGGGHPWAVWLRFAALLHPAAREDRPAALWRPDPDDASEGFAAPLPEAHAPRVAAATRRLRLGGDEARWVEAVIVGARWVEAIGAVGGPSDRAAYRFHRALGSAAMGAVLLALANAPDGRTGHQAALASAGDGLLEAGGARRAEIVDPAPWLDGHELMARLGLQPGPLVGRLMESLREATAAGAIADADEAEAYARRLVAGGQS